MKAPDIQKIKGDITNMTGQFRLQKEIRAQVEVKPVIPKADQTQKIKVTADTTDANAKIAATKGDLQDITAHTWKVNADANTEREERADCQDEGIPAGHHLTPGTCRCGFTRGRSRHGPTRR